MGAGLFTIGLLMFFWGLFWLTLSRKDPWDCFKTIAVICVVIGIIAAIWAFLK